MSVRRNIHPAPWPWLTTILAVACLAGIVGYLAYSTARGAILRASFELPEPGSLSRVVGNDQASLAEEARAAGGESAANRPSGAQAGAPPLRERVNILVIGLDVPDRESEPARTDTIMVVSLSPSGGPVSILSIPRDLWVPVGPYGESRINTAYFLGETQGYPGGGPALLRATIEQVLGVHIDHYVCVDFDGFRRLIDALGGVTVTVDRDIYDAAYPDGKGGVITIFIPAGTQRMDGETALRYARSRHDSSDFDRARRQQKLLLALRDQLLAEQGWPVLLAKLPQLYAALGETVETDLTLDEITQLARLASTLDPNSVELAVLDESMTSRYITDKGWDVLLPIQDKIRPVVERLFSEGQGREPQVALVLEPSPEVAGENASIAVFNGSGRSGLAEATADFLRRQGLKVVQQGDLDRGDYEATIVVVYTEKPATVAMICSLLGLTSADVRLSYDVPSPEKVDIKIILGRSFQLPS